MDKHEIKPGQRDTIKEYNNDIDKGIKEIKKGNFYTQAEAKKLASNW